MDSSGVNSLIFVVNLRHRSVVKVLGISQWSVGVPFVNKESLEPRYGVGPDDWAISHKLMT